MGTHSISRSIELTHTDSGVNAFTNIAEDVIISHVVIHTRVAFDGTTPTVTVETVGGSVGDIMSHSFTNLGVIGVGTNQLMRIFDTSTDLQVTLTPDGSTTGTVRVTLILV